MEETKDKKIEIDEKIFDFVFGEALRDATQQKAYLIPKDEEIKEIKKKAIKLIGNKVKGIVKTYVDDIVNGNYYCFYATADDVSKKISSINIEEAKKVFNRDVDKKLLTEVKDNFTFGNIQKLINMTAKYFYIMCYNNDDLCIKFKNCHCPMDSIMIKKVREKYKKQFNKNGQLKPDVAWSKLEKENNNIPEAYVEFQRMIRELCGNEDQPYKNPLEFDFIEWNNEK